MKERSVLDVVGWEGRKPTARECVRVTEGKKEVRWKRGGQLTVSECVSQCG